MGQIGTERREVEFEPLTDEPVTRPAEQPAQQPAEAKPGRGEPATPAPAPARR